MRARRRVSLCSKHVRESAAQIKGWLISLRYLYGGKRKFAASAVSQQVDQRSGPLRPSVRLPTHFRNSRGRADIYADAEVLKGPSLSKLSPQSVELRNLFLDGFAQRVGIVKPELFDARDIETNVRSCITDRRVVDKQEVFVA